jgi:hypothetical protein
MIKDSELLDICAIGDFLTSDKYLRHAIECDFCAYVKTDLFWRGGHWRAKRIRPHLFESRYGKTTLIYGHSDKAVSKLMISVARIKGYSKIFGINLNPIKSNSFSIPLGLTNDTDESPFHRIFGNSNAILTAIKEEERPEKFRSDIYANFTIQTNSKERLQLFRILQSLNVSIQSPNMTHEGRLEYLRSLRTANFVVCPEGNGVDTHRLWETLYVGGTPIVKRNPLIDSLLVDLPVLLVNSWEELTDLGHLETSWVNLQSRIHSGDLLRFSYWNSILLATHTK